MRRAAGGNEMETRTCARVILTTNPSHHRDCREKFIQTSNHGNIRIILGPPQVIEAEKWESWIDV